MQFFTDNILLIYILPLIAAGMAFIAHFCKFIFSKNTIVYSSIVASFVGLIFAIVLYCGYFSPISDSFAFSTNWLQLNSVGISMGILIDSVSVVFLLILMLISLIVQWYSANYMADEHKFNLYYCLLNLLLFSMISLVLSSNMFQTYVFANIVGILTYLFINFYSKNFQVSKAAKRFLIFDRIGDAMFLAGLIIILYFVINYPIYQSEEFLSYTSLPEAASDLYVYLSDIGFYSVCLLFLISALIKTAQFPFQNVMIDSSEAPLPVCILIQTATNVAIGIFICIRLLPLFNHSELLLETIICLSLINVLICSFFAVAQENIKKMLAYSTSAQFGLMFLSIGLLLPNISLFYLLTHSVAKALLFIVVGLFIKNSIDKCGDFENIKIERKGNPLLVCSYIVSIVSLAGICFGGFFAKEALFENIQILNSCCVSIIFSLAIFMNTYYLFKSYFKIFKHNETTNNINVSISDKSIMITLTLLVVFATYLISQDLTFDSFKDVISSTKSIFSETSLLIIAFVGALLAYGVTIKKWESLPPIINNFARNGGYMNKIFDFICDNIYEPICLLFKKIDKYFINTIYSCFENITKTIAWVISYSQTGNIQSYFANAIFVIIVILVFCLLITVGIGEG